MNLNLPIDGGCRCDRVRIRLTEGPIITAACHCAGCQRMSSSAFSLTAMHLASAFAVTKGEPVIGGLHRNDIHHFFCGYCMTWMFTRPALLPHVVNVRPTMFDDHAWFAPFMETYAEAKLPWAYTGAIRSFPEFPSMESFDALLQEYVVWSNRS